MGYIGRQPGAGIRSTFVFTAVGGETSLSGTDDNGKTLAYADSKFTDVYLNGVQLVAGDDYTATTLTSIDSLAALVANDIVVIFAYDVFSVANHYTKDESDNLLTDKLNKPGTSIDPGLAFDTWRTPNANRPTLIYMRVSAETDGATDGTVTLDVDESGGTTVDYIGLAAKADTVAGSGFQDTEMTTTIIPAGGSYQIRNFSDPNAGNSIDFIREFTL